MFKKSLFLGLASGVLSGIAGVIFEKVYATAFYTDFSVVSATFGGGSFAVKADPTTIMLAHIFSCVLASVAFTLFVKWFKAKGDAIFSLLFTMVSFMSIVIPISATFPLDLDESIILLFPGFAMTMHFFPVLIWLAMKPLFFSSKVSA